MASESDDILNSMSPRQRAQSKLHDPTPQRKKYVTDLLYRFFTDQITFAQLTGIPQKELLQLAEIGHVKLKHGRVHEAFKIFKCLVKVDQQNPFYHSCLGSAFQKMKKFVDAVYEYTQAIKLKTDDLSSMVNRGEIYLTHRNYKRAAEDFRSAILLDPQGKNAYANRARSLVIAIKRNLQLKKETKPGAQRIPAGRSKQLSSGPKRPPSLPRP